MVDTGEAIVCRDTTNREVNVEAADVFCDTTDEKVNVGTEEELGVVVAATDSVIDAVAWELARKGDWFTEAEINVQPVDFGCSNGTAPADSAELETTVSESGCLSTDGDVDVCAEAVGQARRDLVLGLRRGEMVGGGWREGEGEWKASEKEALGSVEFRGEDGSGKFGLKGAGVSALA